MGIERYLTGTILRIKILFYFIFSFIEVIIRAF